MRQCQKKSRDKGRLSWRKIRLPEKTIHSPAENITAMCVCKDTLGIPGITKGCLKSELGNACLLVVSIFYSTAKWKLEAQVKMFLHLKHVEIQGFLSDLPLLNGSSTASEHRSTWSVFPSQISWSNKRYHKQDLLVMKRVWLWKHTTRIEE